jgi:hypothetical protein
MGGDIGAMVEFICGHGEATSRVRTIGKGVGKGVGSDKKFGDSSNISLGGKWLAIPKAVEVNNVGRDGVEMRSFMPSSNRTCAAILTIEVSGSYHKIFLSVFGRKQRKLPS